MDAHHKCSNTIAQFLCPSKWSSLSWALSMVPCSRAFHCSMSSFLTNANELIAASVPRPSSQWQPHAHVATPGMPNNSNWLLDSGALHHVTTDLSNLSIHAPYERPYDIVIGNGTGHPITHTDSKSLSTPSHIYKLDNVLCVPPMKKNLSSISQFCQSNNTSIEFLPTSFCVKDLSIRATFL